ncbi:aldo/keto reductase [Bifidobacterium lemurum]|uniref:Aldo/keto reductase n=1 Tax=Bifidobacterium lemurum TaxID=1603886 RepID=A0A261FWI9_9BIFI|nr:aldo/keto reductase [Bifidobacterium lemurum]OZG63345.1 aldo/keto reductase [Bifidobacterium lemurum]QOL34256.1 aldo/keto reductase [Bifidobacterium lemurum]
MNANTTMPKIALGAWSWGSGVAGGDQVFGNHLSESELKPVFDTAMGLGLNLWDTAAVYGEGSSERILGDFVKDTDRDNVLLSTKFTPQIASDSPDAMQEMLDGSKERLHTDVIDVYWIHNPMEVERWTPDLIALAKSGQIRSIGVSNHNLDQIIRANEILGEAGLHVSAVQNHYSLLHRSSERAGILDYCKEHGITFYAYMVLEQGALTGKYDSAHPFPQGSGRGDSYNPHLAEIERLTDALRSIGDRYDASPAQVAIAWAIAKGTLPIIGVTKVRQVEEAAAAAQLHLADDEVSLLERLGDETGVNTLREWEQDMETSSRNS